MAAPAPSEEKLSASQLGWYGLGAVPHGVGITVGTFLVFYYNQVLGVPGASVGLAILVGSIFDAVTDQIVPTAAGDAATPISYAARFR